MTKETQEQKIIQALLRGDRPNAIARSCNMSVSSLSWLIRTKEFSRKLKKEGERQLKVQLSILPQYFDVSLEVFKELAIDEDVDNRIRLSAAESLFKATLNLRELSTSEAWEKKMDKIQGIESKQMEIDFND